MRNMLNWLCFDERLDRSARLSRKKFWVRTALCVVISGVLFQFLSPSEVGAWLLLMLAAEAALTIACLPKFMEDHPNTARALRMGASAVTAIGWCIGSLLLVATHQPAPTHGGRGPGRRGRRLCDRILLQNPHPHARMRSSTGRGPPGGAVVHAPHPGGADRKPGRHGGGRRIWRSNCGQRRHHAPASVHDLGRRQIPEASGGCREQGQERLPRQHVARNSHPIEWRRGDGRCPLPSVARSGGGGHGADDPFVGGKPRKAVVRYPRRGPHQIQASWPSSRFPSMSATRSVPPPPSIRRRPPTRGRC